MLEAAKELAANCWNKTNTDIDPIVAEEVAKAIDIWMRATTRRQLIIDEMTIELEQLKDLLV